jgi:hypothetical protein
MVAAPANATGVRPVPVRRGLGGEERLDQMRDECVGGHTALIGQEESGWWPAVGNSLDGTPDGKTWLRDVGLS